MFPLAAYWGHQLAKAGLFQDSLCIHSFHLQQRLSLGLHIAAGRTPGVYRQLAFNDLATK